MGWSLYIHIFHGLISCDSSDICKKGYELFHLKAHHANHVCSNSMQTHRKVIINNEMNRCLWFKKNLQCEVKPNEAGCSYLMHVIDNSPRAFVDSSALKHY